VASDALIEKIDTAKIPRHIAIIMDGNGRWARRNFMPRVEGHRAGVNTVDRIVSLSRKLNISALTLYSFSDENWNRPELEIKSLMKILNHYLEKELSRMNRENIRFNVIGRVEDLPSAIQERIEHSKEQTCGNDGMVLTLALSYGGQQEILEAARKVARLVYKGQARVEDIDAELFENQLYTWDLPRLDLLIRTSGEMRLSNFLLYQLAYTELHVTSVLWPDFKEEDFLNAIIDFQNRQRRFGKTQEQIVNTT
tara:strand:- start:342 stop:1100 length:759 start_codon:yes stop_codon:yes gene_type:complete